MDLHVYTNQMQCRRCGGLMTQADEVTTPGDGPTVVMYVCDACSLKAALIYEPTGGLNAEQATWVEQQIAQRGAFFPSDYTSTRGPRY